MLQVEVEYALGEGVIDFLGLVMTLCKALQHGANQHLVLGWRCRFGPAEQPVRCQNEHGCDQKGIQADFQAGE